MAGPFGGTYDGGRAAAAVQARRLEKVMEEGGWQIRYDGAHDQFVASKDVLASHTLDGLLLEVERAQGREPET